MQISTDGGQSWTRVDLVGGYPGAMNNTVDACNFPAGEPVFTGQNLAWAQKTVNLSPWAGQQVQLRFIFSTDGSVNGTGWWLDDIAIGPAIVPGACLGETLFWDGFESGNAGAWSFTQP